ncbi:hypothetical protein LTR66_007183 [Elasticomyces elasticus]|nr:hypothetical protein LTR66_007183 [Elasticomyces elasticus]
MSCDQNLFDDLSAVADFNSDYPNFEATAIDRALTQSQPPSPSFTNNSANTYFTTASDPCLAPEPDFSDFLMGGTQSGPTSPTPYYTDFTPVKTNGFPHQSSFLPVRAHSQPPEDTLHSPAPTPAVTFHRSGHYLGKPTVRSHPDPHALKGAPRRSAATQHRYHPYPPAVQRGAPVRYNLRRAHTQPMPAPTSAPCAPTRPVDADLSSHGIMSDDRQRAGGQLRSRRSPLHRDAAFVTEGANSYVYATSNGPDETGGFKLSTRTEQTTAVLAILNYVDRLIKECEGMKTYLRYGFLENGTSEKDGEVERIRLEKRNLNSAITELHDPLHILPLPCSGGEDEQAEESETRSGIPTNGKQIGDLDHSATTTLLDMYGIPYAPSMFLHEKKAMYMRFCGASQALMHHVLD